MSDGRSESLSEAVAKAASSGLPDRSSLPLPVATLLQAADYHEKKATKQRSDAAALRAESDELSQGATKHEMEAASFRAAAKVLHEAAQAEWSDLTGQEGG